jgi:hypothetical protein
MDVKDLGTEALAAAARLAAPAFVLKNLDPSRGPRMLKPRGVACTPELGDEWRMAPGLQPAFGAHQLSLEYAAGLA